MNNNEYNFKIEEIINENEKEKEELKRINDQIINSKKRHKSNSKSILLID